MLFSSALVSGHLIRRYKRFLADVELADGQVDTAHCPNTGSMLGCNQPGSRVWLTPNSDPRRKLGFTWELVETAPGELACINTSRPNAQVREAVEAGLIPALSGYTCVRPEVRYGTEKSRIDLHLSGHDQWRDAWVEVKNVTLCEEGQGLFPDAVTTRGQKHLRELMGRVAEGERGVLVFCVNHTGIRQVAPADRIDPVYGQLLRHAMAAGVEVFAIAAELTPASLTLTRTIPVLLPEPEG
jgi:sugar fermentation stimulation protein A